MSDWLKSHYKSLCAKKSDQSVDIEVEISVGNYRGKSTLSK